MAADSHRADPSLPARTPAGVRAALFGEDRAEFERDYRAALDRAAAEFDLTPVQDVLEQWWEHAALASDRPAHQRMLAAADRLRAGLPVASTSWAQVRAELGL
ncbi:MAG TPA: DUF6247 family protein [Mycobacteriales bacterium]|nr:DUF6247 family protein [Mycobacteriales bacterium]